MKQSIGVAVAGLVVAMAPQTWAAPRDQPAYATVQIGRGRPGHEEQIGFSQGSANPGKWVVSWRRQKVIPLADGSRRGEDAFHWTDSQTCPAVSGVTVGLVDALRDMGGTRRPAKDGFSYYLSVYSPAGAVTTGFDAETTARLFADALRELDGCWRDGFPPPRFPSVYPGAAEETSGGAQEKPTPWASFGVFFGGWDVISLASDPRSAAGETRWIAIRRDFSGEPRIPEKVSWTESQACPALKALVEALDRARSLEPVPIEREHAIVQAIEFYGGGGVREITDYRPGNPLQMIEPITQKLSPCWREGVPPMPLRWDRPH